jgi:hypothetical protein
VANRTHLWRKSAKGQKRVLILAEKRSPDDISLSTKGNGPDLPPRPIPQVGATPIAAWVSTARKHSLQSIKKSQMQGCSQLAIIVAVGLLASIHAHAQEDNTFIYPTSYVEIVPAYTATASDNLVQLAQATRKEPGLLGFELAQRILPSITS